MAQSECNHFLYAQNEAVQDVFMLKASMTNFSYGMHAHDEFAFGVTHSGRQDFFTLGEHHHSYPGNLILFNPGDAHDGSSGDDVALNYTMLYVKPSLIHSVLQAFGAQPDGFRFSAPVLKDQQLQHRVMRLSAITESQDATASEYESALFDMMSYLVELQRLPVKEILQPKDALMDRTIEYLQDRIHEEVNLDQLSSVVCLSKYHFLRRFKAYAGMTPHQYWLNCRINRARQALHRGMSLSDVVYTLGFNDLSHFNRRFKPVFGMTPHQYQRLLCR
jgi:AraC-like DNA-binding protein